MKIYVIHEDGRKEIIEIAAPVVIVEGLELDRIRDADGTEHFFTKEGYYDGWGKGT